MVACQVVKRGGKKRKAKIKLKNGRVIDGNGHLLCDRLLLGATMVIENMHLAGHRPPARAKNVRSRFAVAPTFWLTRRSTFHENNDEHHGLT